MRIMVSGDTHGNLAYVKSLVDEAVVEKIETVFVLGDFGVWPGKRGENYLDGVSSYAVENEVEVLFLPGNHEDYSQLEAHEQDSPRNDLGFIEVRRNLLYTGKVHRWMWEDKEILAVGGAVSIDRDRRTPFHSWWPQETLTQQEAELAVSHGTCDILFSHDSGTQVPAAATFYKMDTASQQHRKMVEAIAGDVHPQFWMHGHYHLYGEYLFMGEDDWVCNVVGLSCDPVASAGWFRDYDNHGILDIRPGGSIQWKLAGQSVEYTGYGRFHDSSY